MRGAWQVATMERILVMVEDVLLIDFFVVDGHGRLRKTAVDTLSSLRPVWWRDNLTPRWGSRHQRTLVPKVSLQRCHGIISSRSPRTRRWRRFRREGCANRGRHIASRRR